MATETRSDNKRFTILLVIVAVLLAAIVFLLFMRFFSGDDSVTTEPSDQPITFPDGNTVTTTPEGEGSTSTSPTDEPPTVEPPPPPSGTIDDFSAVRSEADWRDEVIVYDTAPAASTDSQTQIGAGTADEQGTDVWDYTAPTVNDLIERAAYSYRPQDPTGQVIPLIDETITNCGSVDLTTVDIDEFLEELSEHETALCMGESVAAGCTAAKVQLTTVEDIQGTLYLASRSDGECGLGLSYQDDYVNLCSIADMLNAAAETYQTYFEWQDAFAEKPGESFASIFGDGSEFAFADARDCALHEL